MSRCINIYFKKDSIVLKIKEDATTNEILSELQEKLPDLKDFYKIQGFTKIDEDEKGNTVWKYIIDDYKNKNKFIDVEENK